MPADRFLSIGHRGARGHAPENTLLSFDTAIRLGAQMVELDVQQHPSGALLVIHDLRLERTTNGSGRVADRSFDYIRGLDAGLGQQVPTLDEVIDLVDQRVPINVELKTPGGTGEATAELLRRYLADGWKPEQFLVSSFHLPELEIFRQAAPEIPIGVLLCGVPLEWAAEAGELSAQALNISEEFADPQLIADAKARGMKVYVYTVNEPDEIAQMRKLGADGVFTDFPERAL
ncbi:MAG TPA: glycerophosphodiester phosphodiesterase family protein [Nevskiaceae bacterium]|nr:glycerophosphodiester phosphodiesterase family protein [Nevskiaceae bacterium]